LSGGPALRLAVVDAVDRGDVAYRHESESAGTRVAAA
jgi:hypothetical protein